MVRKVYRFLVLVSLSLALLLGCQMSRSGQVGDRAEPEPVPLTIQTIEQTGAPFVWWEAEQPTATNFPPSDRNPFAPANDTESAVLSAGQWIGVEAKRDRPLFLEYQVTVPATGDYFFHTRKFWQHGPFRWRWDDQPWQTVGTRIHLMDSFALRQFVAANWVSLGKVKLAEGKHQLRLELTQNEGAAAFDCFMLTQTRFQARGKLKPNQRYAADLPGWFLFDPAVDPFQPSAIDLRSLNEAFAGEQGAIQVKGEAFVHAKNGQPVRFWAVNTGPDTLFMDPESMQYFARFLAKRGVNMVRFHGKLSGDDLRTLDPESLDRLFTLIAALKQEGIYTCLSIYFPLWLQLQPNNGFAGYTGQNPFALLFFNREFQQLYEQWWRTLLTTVNPKTGKALREDPAIAMIELVNEDSYFFWTFDPYKTIPAPQMALLETQFGTWLSAKYGSLDRARATWSGNAAKPLPGDQPQAGRMGILPPGELAAQRDSRRAQDTAAFLTASQQQFFQTAIQFLRQSLGYRGLVYASNWITADARILGPLDKYSNTVADFMDRHGYFGGTHEGAIASYALSTTDTYQDRSALLFTNDEQKPDFNLPLMDLRYNAMPSTITEVNWTMPNRFRADFPLLAATYGTLQGSDGFFFFTLGQPWEGSLGKFSVASPVTLGQFPATALLYRKGLIDPGASVVDIPLKLDDLLALRGAPVTAPQNLDAFRSQNIPPGQALQSDRADTFDPLAFLVGKVNLRFVQQPEPARLVELSQFIDRDRKTVRSATGQLLWNYDQGLVTVNAPRAQGMTGFLRKAGEVTLADITLSSEMDYGTILAVALDDQPLGRSRRILLQVMSEEQNFGWRTTGYPRKTIQSVGNPPLTVRNLSGTVAMKRSDAKALKVTALDANGYGKGAIGNAARFDLLPKTFYYLIEH